MSEIKVEHKKLGRSKAWGQFFEELNKIELDSRLVGKNHLKTVLHELQHALNPEWSEAKVLKAEKLMTKVLWDLGYRRVDNREKQNSK